MYLSISLSSILNTPYDTQYIEKEQASILSDYILKATKKNSFDYVCMIQTPDPDTLCFYTSKLQIGDKTLSSFSSVQQVGTSI